MKSLLCVEETHRQIQATGGTEADVTSRHLRTTVATRTHGLNPVKEVMSSATVRREMDENVQMTDYIMMKSTATRIVSRGRIVEIHLIPRTPARRASQILIKGRNLRSTRRRSHFRPRLWANSMVKCHLFRPGQDKSMDSLLRIQILTGRTLCLCQI